MDPSNPAVTANKKITHALDLPNLRSKPSAEELLAALGMFAKFTELTNFDNSSSEGDESHLIQAPPGSDFFRWLTFIVGSPLDWIEDEAQSDEIRSQASLRMSERCGRTAEPSKTRRILVHGLEDKVHQLRNIEPKNQPIISILEPGLTEDKLGLKTWGSSLMLANRLVKEAEDIIVSPVLELGAGTGLCGMVAARLGYKVILTDLPDIVDNLKENISANMLEGDNIAAEVLDWTDPAPFNGKQLQFPCIMASDPVYQLDQPPLIANMAHKLLLRESDSRLCIQMPLRPNFDDIRACLIDRLEEKGFECLRCEYEEGMEEFGKQVYFLSLWGWSSDALLKFYNITD